jgi:soluble cytochrome b562
MLNVNRSICLTILSALLAVGIAPVGPALAAEDTELAKQMEIVQDHQKKLRKTIKNASDNAASLDALSHMQAATVACKALVPAKAASVPEAERAKFVAGYRKEMAAMLEHLCKIETAVLEGDNAKAEELFKGLKKIEDDGHEKYSEE